MAGALMACVFSSCPPKCHGAVDDRYLRGGFSHSVTESTLARESSTWLRGYGTGGSGDDRCTDCMCYFMPTYLSWGG